MRLKDTRIGDIGEVFRGRTTKFTDLKAGIGVVSITAMGVFGVLPTAMYYIDKPVRKVLPYLLDDNDVLIACRGTVPKVCLFHKSDVGAPCIHNAHLLAIRVDPSKANPAYIRLALDSPYCEAQMPHGAYGLIVLTPQALENMVLRLPPLEKQNEIADSWLTAISTLRRVREQTMLPSISE